MRVTIIFFSLDVFLVVIQFLSLPLTAMLASNTLEKASHCIFNYVEKQFYAMGEKGMFVRCYISSHVYSPATMSP